MQKFKFNCWIDVIFGQSGGDDRQPVCRRAVRAGGGHGAKRRAALPGA